MAEQAASSKQGDDTMMAALATIPLIGLIIYFGMSDASDFVKHYAKQSIGLLLVAVVAAVAGFVPIIGWIVSCVGSIAVFVGWVVLLINALQGNKFSLPVISDLTDQLIK